MAPQTESDYFNQSPLEEWLFRNYIFHLHVLFAFGL